MIAVSVRRRNVQVVSGGSFRATTGGEGETRDEATQSAGYQDRQSSMSLIRVLSRPLAGWY